MLAQGRRFKPGDARLARLKLVSPQADCAHLISLTRRCRNTASAKLSPAPLKQIFTASALVGPSFALQHNAIGAGAPLSIARRSLHATSGSHPLQRPIPVPLWLSKAPGQSEDRGLATNIGQQRFQEQQKKAKGPAKPFGQYVCHSRPRYASPPFRVSPEPAAVVRARAPACSCCLWRANPIDAVARSDGATTTAGMPTWYSGGRARADRHSTILGLLTTVSSSSDNMSAETELHVSSPQHLSA